MIWSPGVGLQHLPMVVSRPLSPTTSTAVVGLASAVGAPAVSRFAFSVVSAISRINLADGEIAGAEVDEHLVRES